MKEQNQIRQLAFKARGKMPKDYKLFCLVMAHLVKNAHRYYKDALQETEQIAAELPVKKEVEVKSEFAEKEPKLELIDEMPKKKTQTVPMFPRNAKR